MELNSTLRSLALLPVLGAFAAHAQIPNGGFEDWVDEDGSWNPVGWVTTNGDPDVSVEPFSPACQGATSMLVRTWDPGFMTISGTAMSQFAYTERPTILSACLKSTVMTGDKVFFIVSLSAGDSIIASPLNCTFWLDTSVTAFTTFEFPITYNADLIPDSANIIVMAGAFGTLQLGTEIIVDELAFGFSTGLQDPSASQAVHLYPNPANDVLTLEVPRSSGGEHVDFTLFDAQGRNVRSMTSGTLSDGSRTVTIAVQDLAEGVYHYSLVGGALNEKGTVVVRH